MRATGLVRKAMRSGRASTDEGDVTWDDTPDLSERLQARIAELEELIADLPPGEHKADHVAEIQRLRREQQGSRLARPRGR